MRKDFLPDENLHVAYRSKEHSLHSLYSEGKLQLIGLSVMFLEWFHYKYALYN